MFLSMNDLLPGCLFAVVTQSFMIGVNVDTGNKVILYI